ncbi:hypothetical protein EV193_102805 [Herbihabitans rhizosphaerae]|uniref:DUF6292 domain-containing protein n=1 Tax=Herbihabitans rhizosphaerae TaxID=1872711 RepID=A0A4Q7L3R0_9PSEU|nr:DUF6292 family protein [Herbihabitans rhizosphaerae]RZS43824.1 hypothetical protein EV193_102805 [Herbihabitans rhizosphaerae]
MATTSETTHAFGRSLAGYVRAVAVELGVPLEATGFEISDTVTVYIGLAERWPEFPTRDLMLVWTERHGWYVAVETDPGEGTIVADHLGGDDLVPPPPVVARFVAALLAGDRSSAHPLGRTVDATDLARRLSRYADGMGSTTRGALEGGLS